MIKIYFVTAALFGAGLVRAQSPAPTPAAASSDAAVAQGDDQATAELKEHHRHHHHGGIARFVAMSLDTLGVDEAKRPQIEKLQHDLHVCLAPGGKLEKGVLDAIADGVAAGAIVAAKVDAAIDQLGASAADARRCSGKTLDEIHAALSPVERQALVDKVEAHWQVWSQVNREAEAGGLAELSKELALTPDQVEKISGQLKSRASAPSKFDPKKMDAHVQAFAAAFASDSFDAKSTVAGADNRLAVHGAKRMAVFYETVTPLLTPDQRTALAGHLRQHADQQPSVQ